MISRFGTIVTTLALTLACGGTEPSTEAPNAAPPPAEAAADEAPVERTKVSEKRPHIVMVTLDTFRADRLGANGYDKAQTETLDALANAGTRYSSAFSPLPLTIPSHSTMFTGKYPPSLDIRSNGSGMLVETERTLAEILHDEGYTTAASVAAFVTTRTWGFNQGFDAYFDEIPAGHDDNFWHGERPGEHVIDDILSWKNGQDPDNAQFIWVHLYDAHFPFTAPEKYVEAAEGRPYDAEIAYVDDQIQRIVDAYAGTPTLFVFAGDHGEGLGDHMELAHGMFAYNSTQHVPMFFSGTGIEQAVVDEPVSLADLLPTLLDTLGLPIPEGVEGRVIGKADAAPVYMETYQIAERFKLAPQVAIVDGTWKFVDNPTPELYDLTSDMGEKTNVAGKHPEEVERLRKKLEALNFPPPGAKTTLDPEVASQLAALGYTDGGELPDFTADLPDYKDHTKLIRLSQKAEREQMTRKADESLATLEQLVKEYPEVVEFRTRRANLLRRLKRFPEARAAIADALELAPDNANLRLMYAGHLAEEGKFDEAATTFREVAEEVPYIPRVRSLALMALRRTGNLAAVNDLAKRWMKEYPEDYNLIGSFGIVLVENKQYDDGLPLLEVGMKAEKPEADVAFYLAARKMGAGDLEEARRLLEIETSNHGSNLRAAAALLKLYMRVQAWQEQLELANRILSLNDKDVIAHHAKVLALFNQERFLESREAVTAGLAIDPEHPDLVLMDANLLAKEGKPEEGKKRFEEAKTLRETRVDKVREAIESGKMPPIPGVDAKAPTPPPTPKPDNPFGLPEVGLEDLFEEAQKAQREQKAAAAPQ